MKCHASMEKAIVTGTMNVSLETFAEKEVVRTLLGFQEVSGMLQIVAVNSGAQLNISALRAGY